MINCFPFPYICEGRRYSGILFDWPDKCSTCTQNSCEKPVNSELSNCSYGYSYQKITDKIVIAGFIAKDSSYSSQARLKKLKAQKNRVVPNDQISNAVEKLHSIYTLETEKIDEAKQKVVQDYIEAEQYKIDFLSDLKQEINKGLSFVHDYKQINSQIAQNINVVIEKRYEGDNFDKKLESATHPEKAIYWASKFLTQKLNVAKFLLNPDWITRESESDNFRFHGLFIKYLRIYQFMFDKKNIHVNVSGSSYSNVYGNPEAIGVIIHTFLDNALKYSRSNGRVEVYISDEANGIYFSVQSHGPRIKPQEQEKIYQPFYRGQEAVRMQEEGAGYGLYIAQLIAIKIDARIIVEQETSQKAKAGHLTTFSITIPN